MEKTLNFKLPWRVGRGLRFVKRDDTPSPPYRRESKSSVTISQNDHSIGVWSIIQTTCNPLNKLLTTPFVNQTPPPPLIPPTTPPPRPPSQPPSPLTVHISHCHTISFWHNICFMVAMDNLACSSSYEKFLFSSETRSSVNLSNFIFTL